MPEEIVTTPMDKPEEVIDWPTVLAAAGEVEADD